MSEQNDKGERSDNVQLKATSARLDPPVAQRLVALAVVTTGIESDQKLEHFFGGA